MLSVQHSIYGFSLSLWYLQNLLIVLVFCVMFLFSFVFVLCLIYQMLSMSLECSFLITPLVFFLTFIFYICNDKLNQILTTNRCNQWCNNCEAYNVLFLSRNSTISCRKTRYELEKVLYDTIGVIRRRSSRKTVNAEWQNDNDPQNIKAKNKEHKRILLKTRWQIMKEEEGHDFDIKQI